MKKQRLDTWEVRKIIGSLFSPWHSTFINDILNSVRQIIIGQDDLIEKLILSILADGHVFVEGVPGLAKTLIIKTLCQLVDTKFQRLQFTPDLLPADIIGTLIYNQEETSFELVHTTSSRFCFLEELKMS